MKHYDKKMWAGKIPVFICKTCGISINNEDDMKLHVIKHSPENEQEELLNELTSEVDYGENDTYGTGSKRTI